MCFNGANPSPNRPRWCWCTAGWTWPHPGSSWSTLCNEERWIIAPDWRGFGQSRGWTTTTQARPPIVDSYWFPDYMADLDVLARPLGSAMPPVDLVGHSMGGNVAMMYSGVRPQRIRRLVNLEGFGLPATRPAQAPERYAKWMDETQGRAPGDKALKDYDVGGRRGPPPDENQPQAGRRQSRLAGPPLGRTRCRRPLGHPGRTRPQDQQRQPLPGGRNPGHLPPHQRRPC